MSMADDVDLQSELNEAASRAAGGRTTLSVQEHHLDEMLYIEAGIGGTPQNYVPERIITMLIEVIDRLPEPRGITAYFHAENGPTPIRVALSEDEVNNLADFDSDAAKRFHMLETFEMERVIR